MKNLIIVSSVVLAGCSGLRSINNNIQTQRQELQALLQPIDSLEKKREAKWKNGELDEKTDSITRKYIRQLKDSIAHRLQRFDALSDNATLRNNKKATIEYLNAVKTCYKKELDNILFFDDLFDASTFSRLNTAAFFAPGQYMPDNTTYQKARTIMAQITGAALQFSNRYTSRKLKAMFIVTGYADEEDIAPGSELYQSLVTSISTASPDRKQLNRELSSRRATAIKDMLEREYFLLNKKNPSPNLSAIFLAIGKGEVLPGGTITDYKPIDERRRLVLLYWSVVPEL